MECMAATTVMLKCDVWHSYDIGIGYAYIWLRLRLVCTC
jgi:hypothetical protein